MFVRLTEAIAQVLNERQLAVLEQDAPPWLQDLVSVWHQTRAAVLTFNYDTLIEASVLPAAGLLNAAELGSDDTQFAWPELINYQPPDPPGRLLYHAPGTPTFDLLKMHGSTNWYWQPTDTTGVSAARRPPLGTFAAPEPYDAAETARWWPGRTPMIIPPTASKADYYQSPLLREIWLRARKSLADAKRVHIVGYSLPLTDFSTRDMMRAAFESNRAEFVIADIDPAAVRGRLTGLGIGDDRISATHESVEAFAAELAMRCSAVCLQETQAQATDDDALLAVHWGDKAYAAVIDIRRDEDGELVLMTETPREHMNQACRLRGPSDPVAKNLRDLAESGVARGLWVEHGAHISRLIAHQPMRLTVGQSHWRLYTASRTYTGESSTWRSA